MFAPSDAGTKQMKEPGGEPSPVIVSPVIISPVIISRAAIDPVVTRTRRFLIKA
jgi:hypothetical protein